MGIAVFASGSGSNFEALVQRSRIEKWRYPIVTLVSDQPNALVLERAKRLGISTFVRSPKQFPSKTEYEQAILQHLKDLNVEWIVLAGYMRLVGPTLLKAFPWRIVNLHPSLLPAFPGKNAIEQAFSYPVKVTGVTVHFVDEGMDTGPIIDQVAVKIEDEDTIESLKQKIHQVEHRLYPDVIKRLIDEKIRLNVSIRS